MYSLIIFTLPLVIYGCSGDFEFDNDSLFSPFNLYINGLEYGKKDALFVITTALPTPWSYYEDPKVWTTHAADFPGQAETAAQALDNAKSILTHTLYDAIRLSNTTSYGQTIELQYTPFKIYGCTNQQNFIKKGTLMVTGYSDYHILTKAVAITEGTVCEANSQFPATTGLSLSPAQITLKLTISKVNWKDEQVKAIAGTMKEKLSDLNLTPNDATIVGTVG
uniref:Lipoprotein n=1 Tax=Rhabditophanes sp. KR3021 TaxID=114890 RepID=A0AC35UHA6_9BILA